MKRSIFTLNRLNKYSALLILLFAFSILDVANAQQLKGTVQDKDNEPIANATVILEPIDKNLSSLKIMSDEEGSYFIGQVKRGNYLTKVSKEGYALYYLDIDIQDKRKKSLWKFQGKILSEKDLPTVLFKKGDYIKCRFTMAKEAEIKKEFLLSEFSSIQKLMEEGQLDEARKKLDETSESLLEDSSVYSLYGFLLTQFGENEKALHFLEKALELNPDQPDAHFFLGRIYAEKEMKQEALNEFEKELEISQDPEIRSKCYANMGILNRELGNVDEAIHYLKKSLEINPEEQAVYMDLLSLYMERKDLEAAEEIISKLEEMGGEDATYYYNMAAEFWNKKDMEHSIKYFKKTINIDPNFAIAYKNLGIALFSIGNNEEAKKYLNKYLEFDLNPNEVQDINSILNAME